MDLARRIANLAARVAVELKSRITADHPGVAKAWVDFGLVKGQVIVRASYNIASVMRLAKGKYRIVFATPFIDASYCWSAFARNAGNQASMKFAAARATADTKTRHYVEVICTTSAGTLSDSTEINLVIFR